MYIQKLSNKPREVKSIGVGTLFIVCHNLAPNSIKQDFEAQIYGQNKPHITEMMLGMIYLLIYESGFHNNRDTYHKQLNSSWEHMRWHRHRPPLILRRLPTWGRSYNYYLLFGQPSNQLFRKWRGKIFFKVCLGTVTLLPIDLFVNMVIFSWGTFNIFHVHIVNFASW